MPASLPVSPSARSGDAVVLLRVLAARIAANSAAFEQEVSVFHLRYSVFTIGLAIFSAAPIFAQLPSNSTTAKAKEKSKSFLPLRTIDGQPDLQGVWSFANLTPLVRPAEFGNKATLTDEEAAAYAERTRKARNMDRRDGGAAADVSRAYNDAFWDFGNRASNQTSLIIDPPDGQLPPLTPAGQKRADARRAAASRPAQGPEDRNLGERCILGFNSGPPMLPSAYNNNVQIFQTRDNVVLLNEMVHNARIVWTDGRPHGAVRQWVGDSVGHWEGSTLVVDTVNFTDKGTAFMIPTDENYHLTERFTRRGANTLVYEFTIDDPTVQARSWTASVPMIRSDEQLYEYACHEGNYGMVGILRGARAQDNEPDDAAKSKSK
jgi:hypothetical protein